MAFSNDAKSHSLMSNQKQWEIELHQEPHDLQAGSHFSHDSPGQSTQGHISHMTPQVKARRAERFAAAKSK